MYVLRYIPCASNISTAVNDMVNLFPKVCLEFFYQLYYGLVDGKRSFKINFSTKTATKKRDIYFLDMS